MTPAQRKLWLAAHGAPRDMMLVTVAEFVAISRSVLLHKAALDEAKKIASATADHLDNYWRTEPDLPTAAESAMKALNQYRIGSEKLSEALDYALTALQTLANMTDGGCSESEAETTVGPIIADAANKIGESLRAFREAPAAEKSTDGTCPRDGSPCESASSGCAEQGAKEQSVTMTKPKMVTLLKGCAYNLWLYSLCSGPQILRDLFNELKDPKPGDLVMETSTHLMQERDPLEGIGTLVAVGDAPYFATREEARAAGYEDDEPIPTRKVWDITLDFDDGRLFRWENASFIKVKTDR